MPMYEYECESGHRFEEIQKFSDNPIESCECGAKAKRVLTASNFTLKGEGWYRDGYTKKAKPRDTDFKTVAEQTRKAVVKRDLGVSE